jgi:hypothetical protein
LKSVAPGNPSFGEVVGYMQEGVSKVESESDCAIGSDHNTDCVAAEQQNQEVYQFQIFTATCCNKTSRSVHAGVAISLPRVAWKCLESNIMGMSGSQVIPNNREPGFGL